MPAYSLREEECAAVVVAADARAAQAVAVVELEPVGSGWARDDCSPVPQAGGYCVPAAQDDSPGDETAQADCSAESAGYSAELRAADSSPGGYSADSSRDDYWVAPQADDSPRGDYSVVPALADSAVASDDCLVVPRAADSSPGGCSVVPEPADSAVAPDDCSVAPRVADSSPGDCSVAPTLADWAVLMVDDSTVRERPRPDARSGLADFPAGSPVGSRVDWRRVAPVAQHSAGFRADFLAGLPDGPWLLWPVCPEAPP